MSRTPLLPSYASATRHVRFRDENLEENPEENPEIFPTLREEARGRMILDGICMILFPVAAIVATIWATCSGTAAPSIPLGKVPLLPYFAFLFLVISFSFWVGFLTSIAHDVGWIPRLHRQVVVWGSGGGKLVLAGVHGLVWMGYTRSFAEWPHPNWFIVFLAAQAWWDVFLLMVYFGLIISRYL